jgi:hypothetical protein
VIYLSFYNYRLIDPETKNKSEASAAPVLPKTDNTKGGASYTSKEPPIKMKETVKYGTKSGMLIQNHNENNIRQLMFTIVLT